MYCTINSSCEGDYSLDYHDFPSFHRWRTHTIWRKNIFFYKKNGSELSFPLFFCLLAEAEAWPEQLFGFNNKKLNIPIQWAWNLALCTVGMMCIAVPIASNWTLSVCTKKPARSWKNTFCVFLFCFFGNKYGDNKNTNLDNLRVDFLQTCGSMVKNPGNFCQSRYLLGYTPSW